MRPVRAHRFRVACAAFVTAVILTACSSASAQHAGNGDDVAAADALFVASMLPHHELGIRLLNLGAPQAEDVRVRRLIFEMHRYHTDDHARLSRWAFEWGLTPFDNFPGMMTEPQLSALTKVYGSDFDRQWLRLMIDHHLGAVAIANKTIAVSTHDDVVNVAQRIVAVQQKEIASMKRLLSVMSTK